MMRKLIPVHNKIIGSLAMFLIFSLSLSLSVIGWGHVNNGVTDDQQTTKEAAKSEVPIVEPDDELYQNAKQEGKVVVYTTSARANEAKETFKKKYPGIEVEISNMKSDLLMSKVIAEQDAGIYNPDVIITKEVSGAVFEEMVKPGRYIRYLPEDIAAHVLEPFKTQSPGYANYLEFRTLFYNTDDYKEAPIQNWWDLTTPEWKGKVYSADPVNDIAFLNLFTAIVTNPDDMAAAYKEKFGKDIVLKGTENAGYEFIKELYNNGLVTLKSSDDVLDAISKSGKKAVAIAVSGNMSKVQENNWHVAPIYNLKPKTSVPDPGYFYLAKNAPHLNAAKLFMSWMMGEEDGKGAGLEPFKTVGSWVPRSDVEDSNGIQFEALKLWNFDGEKQYTAAPKVRDFMIKLN